MKFFGKREDGDENMTAQSGKCGGCGGCGNDSCYRKRGPRGEKGETGPAGEAATIQVGSVITGAPGSNAEVTNSGTAQDAVLNFVLPRGEAGPQGIQGPQGAQGLRGEQGPQGEAGPQGAQGVQGPRGETGPAGEAATVQIGTVTTGQPGSDAEVTNSGTSQNAVLNFVLPRGEAGPQGTQGAQGPQGLRGEQGPQGEAGPQGAQGAQGARGETGPAGEAATVQIGTVTTGQPGSDAEVTNSGTDQNAVFNFVLPRGEAGPQGIQGAQGPQGPAGEAATVQIGTVTTGQPGSDAEVTNSGTGQNAVFNFVLPRGEAGPQGAQGAQGLQGAQGPAGEAATIRIGTVTTGQPGSDAEVTNSGTDQNAVIDIVLPRGEAGPQGERGEQGEEGPQGAQGPAGEAATIRIGTVTTGQPGSDAEVTNSGTDQEAVFDFVIPRGAQGSGIPTELLSSYSTTQQAGTNNGRLVFERNALTFGNAISHTEGSSDFTIQEQGFYLVNFHGTIAPASGVNFPLTISVVMQENGTSVPGTSVSHVFQTTTDMSNISYSQIIQVTNTPTTLDILGQGGNYVYSDVALSIYKIGDATP